VDNVTHSLVGLMMSRSGMDRKVAGSAFMMVLAANLPDVDVVSAAGGVMNYLAWHRSYTHTLLLAPVMALIPPLIVMAFLRRRISWWAYPFSLLGILSHLVLDWTNVYGIRMLLPFSARWLRLDQTDVVDPWILAILFLAVAAPALAKLVGSEIGSKKGTGPKRGWAWFALVAILAYEGGRYSAHERALAMMGAHLYNGSAAKRLTAVPDRWNPWRWRGIAEGDGFVDIVPMDLNGQFDPSDGRIEYVAEPNPAMDAARRDPVFQGFAVFSQVPFWKVTPLANGTLVEDIDLRFGTPEAPQFEASGVVTGQGQMQDARFTFGPNPLISTAARPIE
jgi:inner membrane protein